MRLALIGLTVMGVSSGVLALGQDRTDGPPVPAPAAARGPRIEVFPGEFNFGEVWQGMPAEGEFTVKNVGDAPLTIRSRSNCGCTVATPPKSPLEPGESCTFRISYDTSRPGDANKRVTLTTNDAGHPEVVIEVRGRVKGLFETSPSNAITFKELEIDSRESGTIRLKNQFDRPLHLRIKEGQSFDPFEVTLREIIAGEEYELTATTKPPLKVGFNAASVVLETGSAEAPTLRYPITAQVPPQVSVAPPRLFVVPGMTQPTQKLLQVRYRVDDPISVTAVRPSVDTIEWKLVPPGEQAVQGKTAVHNILLTLPPYAELPDSGAKLVILTDARSPEYQRFEVAIQKLRKRTDQAAGPAGAGSPSEDGRPG